MALPPANTYWKVTYFIKCDSAGQSETWYVGATTYTDALVKANNVAAFRIALLGQGAALEQIRVSDEGILGDSMVTSAYPSITGLPTTTVPLPPVYTAWDGLEDADGDPLYEHDEPDANVLCRAVSTNLYRRQVNLRSVPDKWIKFDAENNPVYTDAYFATNWPPFVKAVVANGFLIRAIDKSLSTNPRQLLPVGSLVRGPEVLPAGSGLYNWQVNSVLTGIASGDFIRLSNIKGVRMNGLNGVHRVYNLQTGPPTSFQIQLQFPTGLPAPYYLGTGYWRTQNRVYPVIDNILLMRPSERKSGRRFFRQPGRLPAVKPW